VVINIHPRGVFLHREIPTIIPDAQSINVFSSNPTEINSKIETEATPTKNREKEKNMFYTGATWLRGTPLISAITSVCASSFLLFGYDNGVMSGVVISSYWLDAMGNPSTIIVSTITALYDVGAVFGAVAAAFTTEQLGRKRSLLLGSFIVVIGSILMGTCVERIQMMVGRIVTGVGQSIACFTF
jgi:Na+/melibiose symporter-like transporter